MNHTKPLLVLLVGFMLTTEVGVAQDNLHIVSVNGSEMVANRIRVMFTEPLVSDAMIPPGFRLDHRFLESNLPLPPHTYAKAPSQTLINARQNLLRCAVLSYDGSMDPDQACRVIRKNRNVVFAEPWYVVQVQGVPNDPLYINQQALHVMHMAEAWDVAPGTEEMVIAVVDNGVDQSHEDLKPSLYINSAEVPGNMIDDDGNGFVDDYNGYNIAWQMDGTAPGNTSNNGAGGHGTNVAGIVGAATNNGKGIAGVANKCKIFPIKAAPYGTGSIYFGYEAMVYAADRGFKVINCSWGTQSRPGAVKPYSLIDKSVVDYCLAKGSLIVSSAGNHGNGAGGSGWLEFNYPSAFDGVMGVAECSADDKVASTSGLGRNSLVTAPSTGAVTTVAGGGYTDVGVNGTSFASPMAAGAAALVFSKWPSLEPRQVVALLQATAEDIKSSSPWAAKALHGRLDVLAAVNTDPMSIPGFRVVAQRIQVRQKETKMFANGDTLALFVSVKNELGASAPLQCQLRILDPAGWQAVVLTPSIVHAGISSGETVEVGPFYIAVSRYQDKPCMMDITFADGVNNQRQFVYIEPPASMVTLMNNELVYSIGNRGLFGFGSTQANNMIGNGVGFGWRPTFQDLGWTGGLLFCTSDGKVLKAYDNMNDVSDFSAVKPFGVGDTNVAILTDSLAGSREVGVRVHQRCTFPSSKTKTTVIAITVENVGGAPLNDIAAGYFFDWDIGPSGANNRSRLAPEALPTTFRSMGEAELFYRDDIPVVVVCAAVSSEPAIVGVAAGMILADYVDDSDRLSDPDVVTLLSSGTTVQTNTPGDACCVMGMRFPGQLQPGESKNFMIVIGVGETEAEATQNVQETILSPNSVLEETGNSVSLFPNPATHSVNISSVSPIVTVQVVNVMGEVVLKDIPGINSTSKVVNIQSIPNGMYVMMVQTEQSTVGYPLSVNR